MAVEAGARPEAAGRRSPIELVDEALRVAESEPLKAVELALRALRASSAPSSSRA